MRQLIALAEGEFRAELMFAAATGVRAGELHALRWRHVDFDRCELSIESRVDSYGNEDMPKTVAGLRTIRSGRAC
ncbi:hypothetical protein [Bradyrhizobium sp. SBR1B]|uniref:hypothetical protein n=1 Tax=Bradyrhizobium sp. SBR1B TaxID=2663836 RepID=UPI0016061A85|nr:hypothetical protein [Bradyrhizobium sp. SBR1B]MBB4383626.1 integrase [Bradyrhizobium sp. SBR1B]